MQAAATPRNLNLGLALWLLGLSAVPSARALDQECQVDGDCGAGYVCTVEQAGACADIACLPGQVCPEPECETREYRSCRPASCSQASDCPADMVCHARTTSDCATSGATAPAAPCPEGKCEQPIAPPSDDCVPQTESLCTPRYQLPCTVASDCGAGFLCVEQVSGWCSGFAPSPSADGGAAADPIAPECGETRTGKYTCELIETSCQSDADCVLGFVCADDPSSTTCASSGAGSSGRPAADFAPPQEGVAADAGTGQLCAPSPTAKLCLPRDYSYGRAIASDGLASGGGTSKDETGAPSAPAANSDEETAKSASDGCSLRSGGHPNSGWLLMLASICAAFVYRRRSATRA